MEDPISGNSKNPYNILSSNLKWIYKDATWSDDSSGFDSSTGSTQLIMEQLCQKTADKSTQTEQCTSSTPFAKYFRFMLKILIIWFLYNCVRFIE